MKEIPKIVWVLVGMFIVGFIYLDEEFYAVKNSISDLKKADISYLDYICKHEYPGVQDYLDKLSTQESKNEYLDFVFYSPSENTCLYVSTLEKAPAFMPDGKVRIRNIGNPSNGEVLSSVFINNEGTWMEEYLIAFNRLSQANQAELAESLKIEW